VGARQGLGRSLRGAAACSLMVAEASAWVPWDAAPQADVVERVPFLLLGLDLPPTPLFKDVMEKNIIPQVRAAGQSRSG